MFCYGPAEVSVRKIYMYKLNFFIKIFIIKLYVLILISAVSCSEKKYTLLPGEPYRPFIEDAAGKICEKMLVCYRKIYRTVAPVRQREISVQNCRKSALENLDEKLAQHTGKMKTLSVICYAAILDAPCDQMAVTALWNPACVQLRDLSNRAVQ